MSSQILVLQKEGSTAADFKKYQDQLLSEKRSNRYSTDYLCQDKIGDPFVEDAITKASILFVSTSNENIFGFAAVSEKDDYLYIDLVCNAPPPSVNTRSGIRTGAKAIIDAVESYARASGRSSVKLSAVRDVIPYYFRLGYDFETVFRKDGHTINTYLKDKAAALIAELRGARIADEMEAQESLFIQIIQRFQPDFYSEKYQRYVASKDGAVARAGPAIDKGIPMTKLILPVGAGAIGGRKYKKKTIRRKCKKQRCNNKKSRNYKIRRVYA